MSSPFADDVRGDAMTNGGEPAAAGYHVTPAGQYQDLATGEWRGDDEPRARTGLNVAEIYQGDR